MRVKKIYGLFIGSTTLAIAGCSLMSCNSTSAKIDFKKYSTETTRDVFFNAYDNFMRTIELNGYGYTYYIYDFDETTSENVKSKSVVETIKNEKYDSTNDVLNVSSTSTTSRQSVESTENKKEETEYFYQTDNDSNVYVNAKAKTYTPVDSYYSASSMKRTQISFSDVAIPDEFDGSDEAYTLKYYKDDSVYTFEVKYDFSKETDKEISFSGYKITTKAASFEMIYQFYTNDVEYYAGYKYSSSAEVTYVADSKSYDGKTKGERAKYLKLLNTNQTVNKVDLSKYNKVLNMYY